VRSRLTKGIGDASGHDTFDKAWYEAHRPTK
jgi:hypothetical protein